MSVKIIIKFIEYNKRMKVFAERLLELRTMKKISQAALAKSLNVSYAVVCYWETDRSEPTGINLVKLADYFDVTVDYLLGRNGY